MIDFEFLIRKNEEYHMHGDIELFYVLEGKVEFILENQVYQLKKEDYLIVNVDKKHAFSAKQEVLIGCFHISYSELSKLLKKNMILFWCNTTLGESESYEEVRNILKKMINEQYQNQGKDEIYGKSLCYSLLHVLTHDFLLKQDDTYFSKEEHKFDDRKHEIAEYIRLNYDKPISLYALAKQLFLSSAYLSKYIKKQFGMSFVDYVNVVRLNYAVSQLLYSDKSVVRIAMDTGFASSAALNKVFKEKYQMTPTVYRSQWRNQEDKSHNTLEDEQKIRDQVAIYFSKNKDKKSGTNKYVEEAIVLPTTSKEEIKTPWNRMINIGTTTDLLHSDIQEHVLLLKKELKFNYIRFWDIYSAELFLDSHEKNKSYNFDKLDRVLDFLVGNGLHPYIEIGIKPKKVIRSRKKLLMREESQELFQDFETLTYFFEALIAHLMNRYSGEVVEQWYFEMWKTEREEDLLKDYISIEELDIRPYLERFNLIAGTLRKYLPQIKIGGAGLSLRYGVTNFEQILRWWKEYENQPDFLSVYCYPYSVDSVSKDRNQSMDKEILKNSLTTIQNIIREQDFVIKELHVSEWNFTVSNRNVLNDNCLKGAYLVKNMIDSIQLTDLLGYWVGSDLFADYYDSKKLLNGSGGILTKDGIKKPAYYAFDFMNRLGKYIRKCGKHYIITDNGNYNWRIVCHNYKHLDYQYGFNQEDELPLLEQNSFMTDVRKIKIDFNLPVKQNGNYQLRVYSINQKHGSVQDEWIDMELPEELNNEDIRYLKQISVPRMVIRKLNVEHEKLIFHTTLEANEIQFIHVSYQYT